MPRTGRFVSPHTAYIGNTNTRLTCEDAAKRPGVDRTGCPARPGRDGKPRHGDRSAYVNYGCRCPDARDALRLYAKRGREGRRPPGLIDATATRRRLQGAAHLGCSPAAVAAHTGCTGQALADIRAGRKKTVLASTDAEIAAFCYRLPLIPLPDTSATRQVKNTALRNGWAPLAAWDEDTITDPGAEPDLGRDPNHPDAEWEDILAGRYPWPKGYPEQRIRRLRNEAVRFLIEEEGLEPLEVAERLRIGARVRAERLSGQILGYLEAARTADDQAVAA